MDRLPPEELDAEMALIGASLIDSGALEEARAVVTNAHCFYTPAHRLLWDFLLDYSEMGGPHDLVIVSKALRDRGQLEAVGGEEYLIHLAESFADTTNAIYYARLVVQAHELRQLMSIGHDLMNAGCEMGAKPDELVAKFGAAITEVGSERQAETYEARQLLHGIKPLDEKHPDQLKTGILCYDNYIGGIEPGSVNVLAAYPSTGKTAFGMFLCCNIASQNKNALFISVEMRHEQLRYRLAAALSGHAIRDIKRGNEMSIANVVRLSVDRLGEGNIWIADRIKKMGQIVSLARNYHRQHGLALIVIDYLQLCTPDRQLDSRNLEVAGMSAQIKGLAQETGCAVLLLSQLSRDAAKQKRRPTLQDLRDSGAIEQDADVVWFLQRADNLESEIWNLTWFVAKNRLGPTRPEGFPLRFDRPRMQFEVAFAGPDT